ncbi:MAG: dehydrogenase [Pedosphaera sp.]|nr:dehydrogenase [Pedosphaera sp.]
MDKLTKTTGIALLKKLREIRQFEERIIPLYPTDVMVTPVHLHIGQEAVPVGVCAHLTAADTIFFGHRTHGPALAKGMDMNKLMAELYGRTTGCSRSYGGSMHVVDPANGMLGSSAIVGGSIALGVGSALAAKLSGQDRIAVSYFGDGAMDSGVFWESINFAALKQVPVLFVCENNLLSNTMTQAEHLFAKPTAVVQNFMPAFSADGTDVQSVYSVVGEAIAHIRTKRQPAFVECRTKRWMKHQGVDRDDLTYNKVDPKQDDPIWKLEQGLLENSMITEAEIKQITKDIELRIDAAIEFAQNSPFPNAEDLVREV